ncbi:hypothetical protein SprV_0100509100 [Sparganum proliferum]
MARPQDTALARFYGLRKVHKDGAPLRHIVSLKGTPTYGLAKWLFRRLKFLTAESDTTVSSSAQFLEKLKWVSLHPNEVMVSFDVTSLFTSIPQDLAIETIELLLQCKYDETENRLGHAQILQLLKLCLRTYFTFDGTIYEQVKGTPMGSPISGFIAEAVLQRLESLVFQHHKPKFWARYVDDTLVVINGDQLLTFKERLNAVFPDIQFTMEEEENNQPAFLNILVCRKDCGGLKTKVFRKATNTMQVLNFNSNHPISYKRSCVRTLYRRVETPCSERKKKLPNYNTSDGSSKPMATRATSSTGAYAKGTKGLTERIPKFGERFHMSRTFRRLLAAFSHHLGLELHTDRRQPSGVS